MRRAFSFIEVVEVQFGVCVFALLDKLPQVPVPEFHYLRECHSRFKLREGIYANFQLYTWRNPFVVFGFVL